MKMKTVLLALVAGVLLGVLPASAQMVLPTLGGEWSYSNPNAKRVGDTYQWKSAKAVITQDGEKVSGTYECVYFVPEGEKYNPVVKFEFQGKIVSDVIRMELKPPHKGWFQVILSATASELKASYQITNGRANGVSFPNIVSGDPQTLTRVVK